MTLIAISSVSGFLALTVALGLFFWLNDKDEDRLDARLEALSSSAKISPFAKNAPRARLASALPKLIKPFLPAGEKTRMRLQNQLLYAGYYHPDAIARFLAVKILSLLLPWVPAIPLALAGIVGWSWALGGAALGGLLGLIGPGLWLHWKTGQRQIIFRAALPDVLDVFVICMEGGASLHSALTRVTDELRLAHPELGLELAIIGREMQLGRSLGDSFMRFAQRTDLEELRSLAACMNQTDRLGGGLVKTLRIQAESMRERRLHYAEEKAQKAGTKILFPTLLLIFPAIFVIMIGPAALQVGALMQKTKREAKSVGKPASASKDQTPLGAGKK